MKVNVTFPVAGLEQYKALRKKEGIGKTESVVQYDETDFSKDATLFSDTLKAAKSDISERLNAKIDLSEITKQIAAGEYKVDADKLADSIMMLGGYHERGRISND